MTDRPFFGPQVLRAAFVIAAFGWGFGFYGPPVFLHAVIARTGWGLPFVSACVTLHFLIGALVVARLPRLHARFGVAGVTATGSVVLATGTLLWGIAPHPTILLVGAVLSGAGWVTLGAAAINAIIAPWFVRTRPRALASAYNGASAGGIVFSPLWGALIAAIGFGWAAGTVGLLMMLVVAWLARAVLAQSPETLGQRPDGDAEGAPAPRVTAPGARALPGGALWRDRGFLTLVAAMTLSLFAQVGLVAHLYALLVPALGRQGAGLAMGVATIAAIAGRSVGARFVTPGRSRRVIAAGNLVVQLVGGAALILAAGEAVPLLLAGVLLVGAGIGNVTSLPPLIAQVEFVPEEVQRVVSLIVATGQAGYAFAPAVFGVVLAYAGSAPAFGLAMAVQGMAILCFLAGNRAGATPSR